MKKLGFYIALLAVLALFSNILPACKPYDTSTALAKIDTLQRLMGKIDATLIIDVDELQRRHDSMQIKLNTIFMHLPDSGNAETKFNLVKYAGIKSNYANIMENYPVVQFSVDEHREKLKKLTQKVVDDQIAAEEFEMAYQEERAALEELLEKAKQFAFMTYSVKPEFLRLSKDVDKLYRIYSNRK